MSNCGTPTEKASEFLDHHLQPIMKSRVSYIKDTNDFLFKLKNLGKIPENAFLVTADVVGLYPSIPHDEDLEVLRKQLNAFDSKTTRTENLVKMADFVLKNNYFEFNSSFKHKFRERLLELNLLHCMHASLWITLKENFSKMSKFSTGFGLDILIFFLSGQLVKKSLTSF